MTPLVIFKGVCTLMVIAVISGVMADTMYSRNDSLAGDFFAVVCGFAVAGIFILFLIGVWVL